ncbi:MAG: site-2 protease family protein [Anaerolineae bacterium]
MFENSPIAAILSFFIVLIPLILIHELGHFLAAKAVGITILEFGLGFPPKIRRLFTWKETEFTLNWIPLGGFVRPLGEDVIRPLAEEQVNEDRAEVLKRYQPGDSSESPSPLPIRLKSVNEASPIARIVFMSRWRNC